MGIFWSPDPFEFLPAIVVGGIGAVIVRFQPLGMSRTLFAMAATQIFVGIIAVITSSNKMNYLSKDIFLNGFFVLLFVGSACLFRIAARQRLKKSGKQNV